MDAEELKLRQRHQELYDKPNKTTKDTLEGLDLKLLLVDRYGWARGKKMPNGRFNMLEKP
jgi:hypothetical protein